MAYEGQIENFAPAEVDEVTQIILKARKLLSDPAKWTQCDYVDEDTGAFCILGALGYRDNGRCQDAPSYTAEKAALRIANAAGLPAVWAIPDFNDDEETTHEMVLALLDRAAQPTNPTAQGDEQ